MKQLKKQTNKVRWRRFSHAKWAVFGSLHLKITIGVLSLSIVGNSDLKAEATIGRSLSDEHQVEQSDDTLAYDLDDVEVVATRVPLKALESPRMVMVMSAKDIAVASVGSINDLLVYATGVDVRQRGEMGIQTDISIRGGSFDQITLLLNGVNISSPQTGHLASDFPVSLQDIERIEILQDPASNLFGTTAFSGAINLVTRVDTVHRASVHAYGGAFGLAGGDGSVGFSSKKTQQQLSFGYSRSDGATDNSDYEQRRLYYQGKWKKEDLTLSWQMGYSKKDFGANTFYSAAYSDQWEGTERYIASVRAETNGKIHFVPTVYWNRSYDHFLLIRNTHIGENFHRTDVSGMHLNTWFSSCLGKTSIGVEVRNEQILSSNLGKLLSSSRGKYLRKDSRINWSYYLEHNILLKEWSISLGALANMNSGLEDDDYTFYPSVNVSYRPHSSWKLFASYNKALRMPTFTDMYYKSPTNEGNLDLKPEQIEAWTVGFRFRKDKIEWQTNGFFTHGKKMIDWVMFTHDDIYHSANFELDNMGVETNIALYIPQEWMESFVRKINVGYAYMNQKRKDAVEIYKSNYALEYLRHKVTCRVEGHVVGNLNFSLAWYWLERMGSYIKYENAINTGAKIPYKPYSLTDLHISWDELKWSLYVDVNNLWDTGYYDYGNLPQPGRWIKGGVKFYL